MSQRKLNKKELQELHKTTIKVYRGIIFILLIAGVIFITYICQNK